MAKKRRVQGTKGPKEADLLLLVAASLAGIIYQARLFNRQARMNVPEASVMAEVFSLWNNVLDALERIRK